MSSVRKPVTAGATAILIILSIAILNGCGAKKESSQAVLQKQTTSKNPSLVERKQKFFNFLRTIITTENASITTKRSKLIALKNRVQTHHPLSGGEERWLRKLAAEYGIKKPAYEEKAFWPKLIMRVDIIPVELALAQAANESAWGTSRFAREGNNYFGQWCFRTGCGIVPARRAAGATHEVRRFSSASESVRSYMHNLNSSGAYAELRKIRSRMRRLSGEADAVELARGLVNYSGRGEAYVQSLQAMIRKNRALMKADQS